MGLGSRRLSQASRISPYSVKNGRVVAPSGQDFMPIGFHLTNPSFGDNGDCVTHATDALAWGINAVYLDCGVVTDTGLPSWWPTLARANTTIYRGETLPQWKADILQRINAYLAVGLVVIVVTRDSMNQQRDTGGTVIPGTSGYLAMHPDIRDFFVWLVRKYKSNPRVWVNPHCEPPKTDQEWCDMHNAVIDAVRTAGYEGPIILDPPVAGQDLGSQGLAYNPNGSTWLQLVQGSAYASGISNTRNIVNGVHWYGWPTWQRTVPAATTYINDHVAAGFPVVLGEFGCMTVSTSAVGSSDVTYQATQTAFSLMGSGVAGGIWWHGHENDYFRLVQGEAYGQGRFWDKAVDNSNLTWTGQALLAVTGA
jgi:hypothetical protein